MLIRTAAIASCVAMLWFVFTPGGAPKAPAFSDGIVDLSAWDFQHGDTVALTGGWRFFDSKWSNEIAPTDAGIPATMPGPWPLLADHSLTPRESGFGTYALSVRLPAAIPGERFAIETGYIYSAYRLFANGKLIAQNGEPSATADNEVARTYSRLVALPEGAREVDLRLELSNHLARYGGSFVAPTIGLERPMTTHRELLAAMSLFMLGAMLFAATYHIAVHLLTRGGRAMLWFGLCAGLLGTRTLLIEPLANYVVPYIGQDWLWRTNFAISILALPTAFMFFALSFPRQISRRLAMPIGVFCVGAAAIAPVFGPIAGEYALKVFEAVAVATFAYIMWGVIRAAIAREAGSYLALIGWGISATATVHDIMLDNGLLTGNNLIPFGFLAFFLCLSGTIATQVNKSLRDVASLSAKLTLTNASLENAVRERTVQLSSRLRELERNRAELEAARVEAVSASVAKSNFLATMSHEIRTPLNAVLGLASLLSETPLQEDQRRHVRLIKDSGDHLLTVINDILDLSKLDAGRIEIEVASFDPVRLTKGTVDMLAARAREKGLDLRVDTAGPCPKAVMGDAARVRQVLINLVGNAIKFTPKGEVIVTLASQPTKAGVHRLHWTISDTGIGIPADRLPLLFENFAQADSSISRQFGGTGLGLAISKRLCERMGGSINVVSREGVGTTFSVDLPLPEGDVSAVEHPRSTAGKAEIDALSAELGRPIRVLVAEDNLTNQVVTCGFLKSAAIQVDVASNGFEAIGAVQHSSYDVVLMDVQMPEIDGLTATRRIRAMGGPFATLPIVALSANAFARDAEACRAAGMNGHVAKPVRKELLLSAIHQALTTGSEFHAMGEKVTADDEPAFDREAIDHLIESLSENATKELLGEFVGAARVKIEQLPQLLAKTEALTIEVHALKSSARQVGAVALSRLAAELERKAAEREPISKVEIDGLAEHLSHYAQTLASQNLLAG